MALNPYFKTYTCTQEQSLFQDAIIELIQAYGVAVKYLPRETVNIDEVFSEDVLHKFNIAADVEVYVKNVEGFEGRGDILGQFGLEIRDQITFTIARRRWEQLLTEKLIAESCSSSPYQLENSRPWTETTADGLVISHDNESYMLEAGNGSDYTIRHPTPREGDLIWFPMVRRLFTIEKVEHEAMFYPFGRLMTYDLKCELLEYSTERLDTGVPEIDTIETRLSADILGAEMLAEDGSKLLVEGGGSYILEYDERVQDVQADNTMLEGEKANVLDFSEHNPFSETRGF